MLEDDLDVEREREEGRGICILFDLSMSLGRCSCCIDAFLFLVVFVWSVYEDVRYVVKSPYDAVV